MAPVIVADPILPAKFGHDSFPFEMVPPVQTSSQKRRIGTVLRC